MNIIVLSCLIHIQTIYKHGILEVTLLEIHPIFTLSQWALELSPPWTIEDASRFSGGGLGCRSPLVGMAALVFLGFSCFFLCKYRSW